MDDILREVPAEFETERLLIRVPRPGDGAMIHAGVVDALASLRAWPASLPWAQFEPTIEASELHARRSHADYVLRRNLNMLILLKDSGEYVGGTGFHDIDWAVPKLEIGYWCRPKFQNLGITTEAVREISDFAIRSLGAKRLTGLPDAENTPSRRVAGSPRSRGTFLRASCAVIANCQMASIGTHACMHVSRET